MLKIKQNLLLLLGTLLLCGVLSFAQEAGPQPNQYQINKEITANKREQAIEHARKLLTHPLFVDLKWDGKITIRDGHDFLLPDEKPNHTEGVFRLTQMLVSIWQTEPAETIEVRAYARSELWVPDGRHPWISKEEGQQRALTFLKVAFPHFFEAGPLPPVSVSQPYGHGNWTFTWQRYGEDELPTDSVTADIRAMDGQVIGFDSSTLQRPWKHTIKPAQAKQIAAEWVTKEGLVDVEVRGWSASSDYHVGLRARNPKTGLRVGISISVDPMNGSVWGRPIHGWQKLPYENPIFVNDSLPTWTKKGLVFTSNHTFSSMPKWVLWPGPQLLLQDKAGKSFHLTANLAVSPILSSGVSTSSWCAMIHNGRHVESWTYAFNLETGTHRILGMPERPGDTPTIDPDGKWAIVSGTGRDRNTDLDLLPDDLTARGELLGARGRLLSKGDDHHPLFSPDNKWLYFVTTTEQNNKVVHALRRIPAELCHTRSLKKLEPKQIQTILTLPGDVLRLSIYPNGQKLLLQSEKGMFNLSVTDKKATPLAPKNLKDAEVNAPITQTRDGWAGPGDNEVTFSGKTTDKARKVRWRIYSCKFDGSGLKAWTPKENQPVQAYKFPKAPDGKTAIDLARQWALKEIEWEDYLKRQGG